MAILYSDLLQPLKGEPMSSGFSTDRSLTSASAVPYREVLRTQKLTIRDFVLKFSLDFMFNFFSELRE